MAGRFHHGLACAVLASALLLALGSNGPSVDRLSAQEPEPMPSRLLRHVVLYQFKPEVDAAQLQQVIDAFAGLPQRIPEIVHLEHGPNVSEEGKSEGLTYGFVVTFRSAGDLATYLKHPAHQRYVEVVRDRRERVVVFDYWTTGDAAP